MKKPVLVVMAAGMGSRYGGLKQMDPMDSQGHIIRSDTDYAIQIPLELLTRTRHVVGICSANTSPKAFRAALKTGYLKHFIAPEHVVREALE